MKSLELLSKYIQFNKILIATIDCNEKIVSFFDGEKQENISYNEFLNKIISFFDLKHDLAIKSLSSLQELRIEDAFLEISTEVTKNSGKNTNLMYTFIKQNEYEYLISIRENNNENLEQKDNMTKASPKSYIDNRAKNYAITGKEYVLIYVDIDNFKHINDEYGSMIGDMILIEMVSACKSFIGDKGAISRVGGDRFLIIYEIEDDYDIVHDFLFDLKMHMQKLTSCSSRGISITLTLASAQYPSDGQYELLLKKCEKALIRGKNKGRNCFVMYLEEKCGKVTLDDEISDKIVKIDSVSAKNDVYSLITNINQILADETSFNENIEKALALVGDYFYIDRASIARINIKSGSIMKHHVWYNPVVSIKHPVYCVDEIVPYWGKALGNKNYVQIDDYKALPDDYPLKKILPNDQTTATLSFELVVNGRSFGIVRFDMTTGVRHWQPEDLQIFLLISQLFALNIQKNYLKETNFKTLYLDANYGCYNFTYVFKTAGEELISNAVPIYSILDLDIKDILTYSSLIGAKKMNQLVQSIVGAIKRIPNCIYGKHHGGSFVIYFRFGDKALIIDAFNLIKTEINNFTTNNKLPELVVVGGAYVASENDDRLIDAIGNAALTRTLNKTGDLLFFSDDIRKQSSFKSEMVLRIDEALDNNEFLLYLQPKISTKDGALVGAEALTRWLYNGEKLLFPDTFIPLFEEQGVIEKLDYSVFENVCRYQKFLKEEKAKLVPVSVNVSRYVSNFDNYIQNIEDIRKRYDIDPKLIEIEITEGMYYENSYLISDFIHKLHNIGYKVSMDDFGAGYSNLVSMAKLKFDIIKFDKSFCIDLDNENVRIMLDKLIELIKMMKMSTICEGVETKESVDYLTKIGCDSIQGYYYSKPIPYKDFYEKFYKK